MLWQMRRELMLKDSLTKLIQIKYKFNRDVNITI